MLPGLEPTPKEEESKKKQSAANEETKDDEVDDDDVENSFAEGKTENFGAIPAAM